MRIAPHNALGPSWRRALLAGFLAVVPVTEAISANGAPGQTEDDVALSLALAERIAGEVFACARRMDKPRSVHILDARGATVLAARMDGQFADNIDVARRKAEAALFLGENTQVWLQRARQDPFLAERLTQLALFVAPTGLPIVIDGQRVGSLGVGGATGDCAHEALTNVLGPQPPLNPEEQTLP